MTDIKIKIEKTTKVVYKAIASDGTEFINESKEKALEEAKEYNKDLFKNKNIEDFSKELWQTLGLPLGHYEPNFYPWDPDEDFSQTYLTTCKKVQSIFKEHENIINIDVEDFSEFTEYIFDMFVKNHDKCKIIMDLAIKTLKKGNKKNVG